MPLIHLHDLQTHDTVQSINCKALFITGVTNLILFESYFLKTKVAESYTLYNTYIS